MGLEKFILEYCDEDTYRTHKYFHHYTWGDVNEYGELVGFISYFPLEDEEFDLVISHNKNNIYTLNHWRVLRKTIKNRQKYLVINSDSTNKALVKGVKKYGGYFKGNDIHFPLEEE